MPAMKRSPSPSRYHTSVTLFEPAGGSAISETTLRRSKRLKIAEKSESDESDTISPEKRSMRVKVEVTASSKVDADAATSKSTPTKGEWVASPRKQKPIRQSLDVPHPAPARWRETYDAIVDMRSRIVAPVDTMGCGRAQLEEIEPKNQRFSTLVSLMLSSQTKDEVTSAAVSRLREALGGSLSVEAVIAADDNTISEAICKVGFWRRKTQYLKQAAQRLHDDFDSDVPKTVDELCSLPGVGPKMAFLALNVAWKLNAGIGVDVHVHRITNRLGWHKPPTKTPEETRLNLQSWLPIELHSPINELLVGFGQTICLPVGPRCDSCELSKGLCPSARTVTKSKSKKTRATASGSGNPQLEIKLEEDEETVITPAAALEDLADDLLQIKSESG